MYLNPTAFYFNTWMLITNLCRWRWWWWWRRRRQWWWGWWWQ